MIRIEHSRKYEEARKSKESRCGLRESRDGAAVSNDAAVA